MTTTTRPHRVPRSINLPRSLDVLATNGTTVFVTLTVEQSQHGDVIVSLTTRGHDQADEFAAVDFLLEEPWQVQFRAQGASLDLLTGVTLDRSAVDLIETWVRHHTLRYDA